MGGNVDGIGEWYLVSQQNKQRNGGVAIKVSIFMHHLFLYIMFLYVYMYVVCTYCLYVTNVYFDRENQIFAN